MQSVLDENEVGSGMLQPRVKETCTLQEFRPALIKTQEPLQRRVVDPISDSIMLSVIPIRSDIYYKSGWNLGIT